MQWDHPEPKRAHPATLRISDRTEVTVMARPVTADGRGWKVFIQHDNDPLEARILFGSNIEEIKQDIIEHPEYFA